MEKTTIEYLKNINKKREKRNEIKEELIKKIKYFYWISKETKELLINKITEEFDKNENEEKSWNVFSEVSKQNKANKERKDRLTTELLMVKSEIQKEKRKCTMLKKKLVKEDFSWVDEYSIKKRKNKRNETKTKIEQFNIKIKSLEIKKENLEQEISQIEVIENKKKLHNSRKSLKQNETNYKKYTINELIKYDIWLSKELKDRIKHEVEIKPKTITTTHGFDSFVDIVMTVCSGSVIAAIIFWTLSPIKDQCEILVIVWRILWTRIYIICKKAKASSVLEIPQKKLHNIKSFWIFIVVSIYYLIMFNIFAN